ncbi:MAG: hypothetical protein JO352_16220 [Chloroflexi bacterium]|nr:hypothetical protein [Chloroflexota bacterium]
MNGGGTGSLQGYRISEDGLRPIADSARSLDITPASGPSTFLMTPGQVGFTPDGEHLVVTTKTNGNHIDVFQPRPDGRLSRTPVVNAATTPVIFGTRWLGY